MRNIQFVLRDKLPWLYEAVIAIYTFAPGGAPKEKSETQIRKETINAYINALQFIWHKAFGAEHICERKAIGRKIRTGLESYYNTVKCNNRKQNMTKQERLQKWKTSAEVNKLLDIKKQSSNPQDFNDNERLFYFAQQSMNRTGFISEDIDIQYETAKEDERKKRKNDEEQYQLALGVDDCDEENTVMEDTDFVGAPVEQSISMPTTPARTTRSGTIIYTPDFTPPVTLTAQPAIRKTRNCTDEIKAACAKVFHNCFVTLFIFAKFHVNAVIHCSTVYLLCKINHFGHKFFPVHDAMKINVYCNMFDVLYVLMFFMFLFKI